MTYALFAPWYPADFAGVATVDIRVGLSGASDFTATIPIPSPTDGDPVEGGSYFTTPFNSLGSWFAALKTAFELADPELPANGIWAFSYTPDNPGTDLPMRTRISRVATGPAIRDWQILWTHASTTFDPNILGYFALADGPVTGNALPYDSIWQVSRAWFHRLDTWMPGSSQHRGVHLTAGNYEGSQQIISVGSVTKDRTFPPTQVEGVRVLLDNSSKADLIPQVPGMVLFDPNTPIENLWSAMTIGRKPIRLIEDVYNFIIANQSDYQLADMGVLRSVDRLITQRKNEPRYYNLKIPLQDYVAP